MRDLLAIMLRNWKQLLVCGVILGLLLGGCRAYSTSKTLPKANDVAREERIAQRQLEEYNDRISMLETEISNIETRILELERYNEESLLMKVDPYSCETTKLCFSVFIAKADNEFQPVDEDGNGKKLILIEQGNIRLAEADRLLNQYVAFANNLSFKKLMSGTPYEDEEERYLRELITISVTEQGIGCISVTGTSMIDGSTFCRRIWNAMQEMRIDEFGSDGDNQLVLLSQNTIIVVNSDLRTYQANNQIQPLELTMQIATKNQEISEMEKPSEYVAPSMMTVIKSGIKYAILGGVVGVCMAAVLAVLGDAMSDKLRCERQLTLMTKLRCLGNVAVDKPVRGLKKCADTLQGVQEPLPEEKSLPLICANIQENEGSYHKVLLTGSLDETALSTMAEKLQAICENRIQFIWGEDVNVDSDTVYMLSEADACVLVERKNTSNLSVIVREVDRLQKSGKEILGFVLC